MTSSLTKSEVLQSIEREPLDSALWEAMTDQVREQKDTFSVKSLEVIIDGLKKLENATKQAEQEKREPPPVSKLFEALMVRFVRAYNSPKLMKEVGLIYLRDLCLPEAALSHFEAALRLGAPETELRPLRDAAAQVVEKAQIQPGGDDALVSSVMVAQHTRPVASTFIRKTGSKLMLSQLLPAPEAGAAEVSGDEEVEPEENIPDTTAGCLKEAESAIKRRQFSRAEAVLRKADQDPAGRSEMWQAWTDLGLACFEARRTERVETAFVEAFKYNPKDVASHFNVALGYHINGKHRLAMAEYKRANEIDPDQPKIWCNMGALHFQEDHYMQAELAMRFAIRGRPEYARAWDNLAAVLGAQNRLEDAMMACKRAVEFQPGYPEAHFKMGIIYFSLGEDENAAVEFRRAARMPELAAYCDSFQSMIHSRLGEMDKAEAAARSAAAVDSKVDLLWMAWNNIGKAWNCAGNYERAITAFEAAAMLKPDEASVWVLLSVTYQQIGEIALASNAYQQAADLQLASYCAEK